MRYVPHFARSFSVNRLPLGDETGIGEMAGENFYMQTIALVDDDRNILTSVSIALEAEGYRVETFTDGASALTAAVLGPAAAAAAAAALRLRMNATAA